MFAPFDGDIDHLYQSDVSTPKTTFLGESFQFFQSFGSLIHLLFGRFRNHITATNCKQRIDQIMMVT